MKLGLTEDQIENPQSACGSVSFFSHLFVSKHWVFWFYKTENLLNNSFSVGLVMPSAVVHALTRVSHRSN